MNENDIKYKMKVWTKKHKKKAAPHSLIVAASTSYTFFWS